MFCVFSRINCFNALSTQCPFGGYKMSGNGRELWVLLGCLPSQYTQISHSITSTDFVFWKPTFPNCLTWHKSLSKRILQYFWSQSLQQCIHNISMWKSAWEFKQNEQHCYYFLFQGRKRLEGVLRSEDHHNEVGRQELLRQPPFVWEEVVCPSSLTCLLTVRPRWKTTLTIKTSYLHGNYRLYPHAASSPSIRTALLSTASPAICL